MRYAAFALWLLFSSLVSADDDFKPLFNGKDLTGWDGDPQIWSVEDGLLTGQTKARGQIKKNTFLIWKDGEVGDFELRLVFRMEGENNSGVQYRSQRSKDDRKWGIVGYQADMHPAANYCGMLYDEGGRGIIAERGQQVTLAKDGKKTVKPLDGERKEVDLGKWNELVIIARGDRLIHKLNGEVTVDITDRDEKDAEAKGLLALQVHAGPAMKIQFKSVELKSLNKAKDAKPKPAKLDSEATPEANIKTLDGFQVELLYSVPKPEQGSWVNLCVDPKGRLIVSDQSGGLYRVTVPPVGTSGEAHIERIPIELGHAQGLLWAFDSLYVVVNGEGEGYRSGLYRVRDSNGDDQLDSVERLRRLNGGGEHGPHAIVPTPDGKSFYLVCGNNTKLTRIENSCVPRFWDEDQLLPRIYGVGFMKGTPPPAGCIYKIDPDGKNWELVSCGFRNPYDIAVNADGELFTFDADMEWDFGTPWYRPTRVCHVVSGVDWGWRNGSAKWPVHYADTLPPVVDIGPGSPTGITFGYGAKFPAKYQNALYLCDWTYGKLYALHLEPRGASYGGTTIEEFVTATPLPLTDAVINPHDGAMYFTIGGRNVQSGLYRVTYIGDESTAPVDVQQDNSEDRLARQKLEAFHHGSDPQAVEAAWAYLSHEDRFLRHAARTVLEHQLVETWRERALAETDPQAAITAILALVRTVPRSYKPEGAELDTPPPSFPANGADCHPLQGPVFEALGRLDWQSLTKEQQLETLRACQLALYRLGTPDEETRHGIIERLDAIYPTGHREQDTMITEIMCYLQAPSAAKKGMALLAAAPTQEGQLDLVRSLRFLEAGWTPETRRQFFEWFHRALSYKGGNNFANFVNELKNDAVARLSESEKRTLASVINAPAPKTVTPLSANPRPMVKEWKLEEVAPLVQEKLDHRNFDRGRQMFAAANCFGCHRFANEGGAMGPDLTALSGRFSARDILESVMEPDKVVSDQYASVVVVTDEGQVVTGRVVNFQGDEIQINTDMLDPNAITKVKRSQIEEMSPAKTSMMPAGLLNTLHEEELLDLMAFLLSRGDRKHEMFAE